MDMTDGIPPDIRILHVWSIEHVVRHVHGLRLGHVGVVDGANNRSDHVATPVRDGLGYAAVPNFLVTS